MPEPAPDRPPDYFDRLLARQMPIAEAGRVRPRLPGPFERAEARWTETLLPEEPASPTAAYPAPEPAGPPPVGPIRVERHTEIRTGPPVPAPPPEPPAPNPRWITRPAPESASVSTSASDQRPTSSGPAHGPAAVRPAPTRPTAEPVAAARPTPAGPAVPRSTPSPAARRATTPPPAPRRRTRPAEPAVHIRIGRLEVRAGGAPAPVATPRAARPAPAVSLSDYLSGSAPRAEGRR